MKNTSKYIIYFVAVILLLGTLVSSTSIKTPTAVATYGYGDDCGEKFTYEKSSDYSDSRVNINFESNDRQIDVSAKSGYKINKVWLDVDNDGHSGYYLYANGPVDNFNPSGDEINEAKVEVEKVCTTPTPTITNTPTTTPTVTPTTTVTPTITTTPTVTPTPTDVVCGENQQNQNGICIDCDGEGTCEIIIGGDGTPTPTPTEEITPTPTETPNVGGPGDGLSDGRSDGRSDGLGGQQAVLGANTMATTGTFDSLISNALLALGLTFTTLASAGHATKKKLS